MLKRTIVALAIFFSLISMLFIFMFNGIKVNSFSLGGFYVSQLYIKLDKKLIVKIDEMKMNRTSKVQTTKEDLQSILSRIPTVLKYFEIIDIESLKVQGNHLKILYDNEMLYVDSKYINLSSKYSVAANTLQLDLYSLYLKEQEALFLGKLKVDYYKGIVNFFGNYEYQDVIGALNVEMNDQVIDFFVNTQTIKDITFLRSLFRLDSIAEAWMYDNVTGDMKLNQLYGRLETATLKPVMSHIKGEAVITNAKVRFNPKVAAADVEKLVITFMKDRLSFELQKPSYKGISIEGSAVDIHNLTSLRNGRVDVRIKAKHQLDQNVLEVLEAFEINVPVKQTKGVTKADLLLSIPYSGSMKTHGDFDVYDARVNIGDFPLQTKFAKVKLRDQKLTIQSNQVLHKKMIDTKVDLSLDTKSLQAKGVFDLNRLFIKEGDYEVVLLQNKKLPLSMDFNEKILLSFPTLDLKIDVNEKSTKVSLQDLKKIYAYSNLLKELKIKEGSLNLAIQSAQKMSLNAVLKGLDLPLYSHGQKLSTLKIEGEINQQGVFINSTDKRLGVEVLKDAKRPKVSLKHLDIVYATSNNKDSKPLELDLFLDGVRLNIDEVSILAKRLNATLLAKRLSFDGLIYTDLLPLSQNGEKLFLYEIEGEYNDELLSFKSKDSKLAFELKGSDEFDLTLEGLDLLYNTDKANRTTVKKVHIKANNSNILINDKYTVLADHYALNLTPDGQILFELQNGTSNLYYQQDKQGKISLKAHNITDKMVNRFFNKELIRGGTISVLALGQEPFIEGHVWLKENRILDLAILNNIITLVNSSPALINPLLAIPSLFNVVTSDGFNLNGYRVNSGEIDFSYNQEQNSLALTTIKTEGNSVDMSGHAFIDLNALSINSKLDLIFMKGYSSVVKQIPLLGYILLGKDRRIATSVDITGSLEDPTIKSNVLKDSASVPLDVIKRIILSPVEAFDSEDDNRNKELRDQRKEQLESEETK